MPNALSMGSAPENSSRQAEMLDRLRGPAREHGTPVDDNARQATTPVNLNDPPRRLFREVVGNLRGSNLFRRFELYLTVNDDGSSHFMNPTRLRGDWLSRYMVCFKKKDEDGKPIEVMMHKDTAAAILESEVLRERTRELTFINQVRLPVLRADGRLELLPLGYDAESRTFTARQAVAYEEDWSRDRAFDYLCGLLEHFPWGDSGRSVAVQIAAMLSQFCGQMIDESSPRPGIFYNANLSNSGKSRLAQMAMYPVHGAVGSLDYKREDEFPKQLEVKALSRAPVIFLDDLTGHLNNNTLYKWITEVVWWGRYMHSQREFLIPKTGQVYLTGNGLTMEKDLQERMLVVDLWANEEARDRAANRAAAGIVEITPQWLLQPENRRQILSALWALVRHWDEQGRPDAPRRLPRFEQWGEIIGGIVTAAGFADPLEPAQLEDAGNTRDVHWSRLMAAMAGRIEGESATWRLTDYAAEARRLGLFAEILEDAEGTMAKMQKKDFKPVQGAIGEREPNDEEKLEQAHHFLDPRERSGFGKLMKRYFGRHFTANDAVGVSRRWTFAKRAARHSELTITRA